MYAFGPLPRQKRTGNIIGTHQKIDRVARRHIERHLSSLPFPSIEDILHFEGGRGPDAIELKTPLEDKPNHFINPADMKPNDQFFTVIKNHSHNLTQALLNGDATRGAFEAAWLAHAVTDGLTPAHHDPYDDQVKDLFYHDSRRNSIRGKVMMSGHGSKRRFIKNNWEYWGAKGIMTTHTLFEAGVASAAKPLSFRVAAADESDVAELKSRGFIALYMDMIRMIYELGMYERFKRDGWTHTLAQQTTRTLLPTIIYAVELAWIEAYMNAKRSNTP